MADTFKQWASTQVHRPGDKITNAQKLSSDYILNKYETWGDVYKAVGIEPPSIPKKTRSSQLLLKLRTFYLNLT